MSRSDLTILTLDAGGTNFVFSAIRDYVQITENITLPAHAHNLDLCLKSLSDGFNKLIEQCGPPDAISFAFPGPADYKQGIIGDLPNFPAFTSPVPLASILENEFKVPVYINNDANLFAAGEAESGFLPALNKRLKEAGSSRRYRNLIGITLGTGFGCGIVIDRMMLTGDNSSGAEIHNSLNIFHPGWNAEEDVSTRGIRRVYSEMAGKADHTPEQIYKIAKSELPGDQEAAVAAFTNFGRSLGASLANVLTFVDGIIVIGGGLTGAWDIFSGPMFQEIRKQYTDAAGNFHNRHSYRVFNLEDDSCFDEFARGNPVSVSIPGTDKVNTYDAMPRTGIGLSVHGVSRAAMFGAYSFAIKKLNQH